MLSTSMTLLKRLQQPEDAAAWEQFVSLYSPLLFRWAQQGKLVDHDAADFVQDLFVFLLNELPCFQYDPDGGRFRNWLKTVLARRIRDRRKRWSPSIAFQGDLQFLEGEDGASTQFWETEYNHLLIRRALELMQTEFEQTTWKACWEHTVSGRTAAEVGRELGMSEAAVYVAKSRVLRRLREELQGLLD